MCNHRMVVGLGLFLPILVGGQIDAAQAYVQAEIEKFQEWVEINNDEFEKHLESVGESKDVAIEKVDAYLQLLEGAKDEIWALGEDSDDREQQVQEEIDLNEEMLRELETIRRTQYQGHRSDMAVTLKEALDEYRETQEDVIASLMDVMREGQQEFDRERRTGLQISGLQF